MPAPRLSEGFSSQQGLNLPEAPTFRPAPEQFADPLAYIASIRPQAEPFGICKIVLQGFEPPFGLDRKARFPTRVQLVHELQDRSADPAFDLAFKHRFDGFHQRQGSKAPAVTKLGNQAVELSRLLRVVLRKGGHQGVTDVKGWRDVCRLLEIKDTSSQATTGMRQLYERHLLAYERHCKAQDARRAAAPVLPLNGEVGDQLAAQILEAMLQAEPEDAVALASNAEPEGPPVKRRKVAVQAQAPGKGRKLGGSRRSPGASPAAVVGKDGIKVPANILTLMCELCGGGQREEAIILCDACDRGCHMFCLNPPLDAVPDGAWTCPLCVAEAHAKGACRNGGLMTLDEFERSAVAFKRSWWGSEGRARKVSGDDIEAEFWRVVESGQEAVEVLCGTGLDTGTIGSGFPQAYAEAPWNLNTFSARGGPHGNVLRHTVADVPGVSRPCLDVGMMFSSAPWHMSPHLLYSASYLHTGAPKKWYAVPAAATAAFEEAFQRALPAQFGAQPDLLFHAATMLSPSVLARHGVPVHQLVQQEGEFIVTFPSAYHATLDYGFNCAESISFASPDWLRFLAASSDRFCRSRQPSLFSHDQLLLQVLERDEASATAFWAVPELERLAADQQEQRTRLWASGVTHARQAGDTAEDVQRQCAVCHLDCRLAALECDCSPGRTVCLHHGKLLCACEPSAWRLVFRLSLAELQQKVKDLRPRLPQAGSELAMQLEAQRDGKVVVKAELPPAPNAAPAAAPDGQQLANGHSSAVKGAEAMDADGEDADVFAALAALADHAEQEAVAEERQSPKASCVKAEDANAKRPVQDLVSDWRVACSSWLQRARLLLEHGNAKVGDVDGLIEEAEQFVWGGPEAAEVPALCGRLREARAWVAALNAALKSKPSLESLEPLLAWDPPPVHHSALGRLREAAKQARSWLERAEAPSAGFAELRVLEALATEAARCGVALPAAKPIRERVSAARKLGEAIRAALPSGREPTRVPRARLATATGHHQIDAEHLRELRIESAALQVDMPEFATLNAALAALTDWQARAREALSMRTALATLQQLATEAESLPAAVPERSSIEELVEKAEAWLERAGDATRSRAPLKKLRDLLHAGVRLGADVPQVETLRADIRRREWEDAAKKALSGKSSLTALQEALSDAATMAAEHSPLLASLRKRLQEAEAWDARAAALLEGGSRAASPAADDQTARAQQPQISGHEEQEANDHSAANGTHVADDGVTEMDVEPCAAETSTPEGQQQMQEEEQQQQQPMPLEDLEALVSDGLALGLKLERLGPAQALLQSAQRWTQRARRILEAAADAAQSSADERGSAPALSDVAELIEEADDLGVAVGELGALRERAAAAEAWAAGARAHAQRFPPTSAQPPEALPAAQALIQGGEALGLEMDELQQLRASVAAATWNRQASLLLAAVAAAQAAATAPPQRQPSVVALPQQQAQEQQQQQSAPAASTISTAEQPAGGAPLSASSSPQLAPAAAQLSVLTASAAAAAQSAAPQQEQDQEQLSLWQRIAAAEAAAAEAAERAEAELTAAAAVGATCQSLLKQDQQEDTGTGMCSFTQLLREGSPDCTAQAGSNDITVAAAAAQATAEAHALASKAAAHAAPRQPPLSEAEELAEEADGLPVDERLLALLQEVVAASREWEAAAKQALGGKKGVSAATPEEAAALAGRGARLGLELPGLPALRAALERHAAWEASVQSALSHGQRPTHETAAQLQAAGKATCLRSALGDALGAAVEAGTAWADRTRRALAKRNSGLLLGKGLAAAASSLDRARAQLARLQGELAGGASGDSRRRRTTAARGAHRDGGEPAYYEEDEAELFCLCQQPYHADTAMVSCDVCEEWYHMGCMRLSAAAAKSLRKYTCPVCASLKPGGKAELEEAVARVCKTRRPAASALAQLAAEAAALPCAPPEEAKLCHLLADFHGWQARVEVLVGGHEAAVRAGREAGRLPAGALSALLKSALSQEVDAGPLAARLAAALAARRWQERACAALQPGARLTVDALGKLLREGLGAGLVQEDQPLATALAQRASAGRAWLQNAHAVLDILQSEEGAVEQQGQAVAAARQLAAEAASLGVKLDREVEKLREASQLYCLCRKPYDSDRPMLSCDYCFDWFHYDCVGLAPPDDEGADGDPAPADFRCPECCMKRACPYAHYNQLSQESIRALHHIAARLAEKQASGGGWQPHTAHEAQPPPQQPQPPHPTIQQTQQTARILLPGYSAPQQLLPAILEAVTKQQQQQQQQQQLLHQQQPTSPAGIAAANGNAIAAYKRASGVPSPPVSGGGGGGSGNNGGGGGNGGAADASIGGAVAGDGGQLPIAGRSAASLPVQQGRPTLTLQELLKSRSMPLGFAAPGGNGYESTGGGEVS